MLPQYIIEAFGKTVDAVIKAKSTDKQRRDYSGDRPEMLTLSIDECKSLCKDAKVEYKDGYEGRIIRYTCSDDSVDRMGDIIKQEGWNTKNFKTNPVIMANHNYGEFPVGNALSVSVVEGKLKMNVLFADKDVSPKADEAFKLAKTGFMKAGSVGFMPTKHHQPDEQEQKDLGIPAYGLIFDEQELLEFSVCGVPANANAIQESISKGLITRKDLQAIYSDEELKDVTDTDDNNDDDNKSSDGKDDKKKPKKELTLDQIKTLIDEKLEQKQGAEFSKKNKALITNAVDGMEKALEALKSLITEPANDDSSNNGDGTLEDKSADGELTIDINLDDVGSTDGDGLYSDDDVLELNLN